MERDLRDQLRRASASIPLNIAEGEGEFSPADKARFYRFARRSAAECGAVMDVIERATDLPCDVGTAKARLVEVSAMLTTLVKAVEGRR